MKQTSKKEKRKIHGIDQLISNRKKYYSKEFRRQKKMIPLLTLRRQEMQEYTMHQIFLLYQFNNRCFYLNSVVNNHHPEKEGAIYEIVDESGELIAKLCDLRHEYKIRPRSETRRGEYRNELTEVADVAINLNNTYISLLESLLI